MKARLDEQTIALRVAKEFEDGRGINLGYGALGEDKQKDYELINASDQPVTPMPGMCFFDSAMSFDMIRGGHIDLVVLGAYQVSQTGDLANWGRPGRPATGMGGGMDLAAGCKSVIVMMLHNTKDGAARIVKQCSFPLTAKNCVDKIFTDLAVIDVTPKGLILKEVAPGWTAEEVQSLTEAPLIIADDLKEIEL